VVAALVLAGVAYGIATALRPTRPIGFQRLQAPDGDRPPIALSVWYPTTAAGRPTTLLGFNLMSVAPDGPVDGEKLPLIVISHGNGGGAGSHVDLALALAAAGFVVAAPTHTGDNFADQSAVGSLTWFSDRHRHVQRVIDFMLGPWAGGARLDPGRIGIFGFSAGGFTALTAVGARPDLRRVAAHCAATPEFACRLLSELHSPLLADRNEPAPGLSGVAPRVRSAVVAAPGLGFAFAAEGLAGITAPVQIWSGDADDKVPFATNVAPLKAALGAKSELHVVPGAGHFAFLAPCTLPGPPMLCNDGAGFDRRAFHADMNAKVVAFFKATL